MIEIEDPKKGGRVREFHSGFTRELIAVLAFNCVFALVIGAIGFDVNRTWPGRGLIFIGVAFVVLVAMAATAATTLGKVIKITSRVFMYKKGLVEVVIPWQSMRFHQTPRPGKKWFRTSMVGDHQTTVAFDSLSFPEFDLVVNLVAVIRKRYKEQAYELGGNQH